MLALAKKQLQTEAEIDVDQVKQIAKALVLDPFYLSTLQKRMREGKLAPAVEVTLWGYAFGKPKEQIEIRKASVVKILHEYADVVESGVVASTVIEGEIERGREDSKDAVEPTTDEVPQDN